MPTKAQLEKNVTDVNNAYQRYQDTIEKHLPGRRVSITNYVGIISTKRGY